MAKEIDWNEELWNASETGNLEAVEKAVANGANVNVGLFFGLVNFKSL